MKITKRLFQRMERCCYLQNKVREEEALIEIELKSLGVDTEKARWNDSCIVDFINYGEHVSKEEVEESLEKCSKESKIL